MVVKSLMTLGQVCSKPFYGHNLRILLKSYRNLLEIIKPGWNGIPGANVMKLFTAVSYNFINILEHLSLENLSNLL
jgi:hypothetical protein